MDHDTIQYSSTPLPPQPHDSTGTSISRRIVFQYLLHHCYGATALALLEDVRLAEGDNADFLKSLNFAQNEDVKDGSIKVNGNEKEDTNGTVDDNRTPRQGDIAMDLDEVPISGTGIAVPTINQHNQDQQHQEERIAEDLEMTDLNMPETEGATELGIKEDRMDNDLKDDDNEVEQVALLKKNATDVTKISTENSDSIPDTLFLEWKSVEIRTEITAAIMQGLIPDAISLLKLHFPTLLSTSAQSSATTLQTLRLAFDLDLQQFIELIRNRADAEAIEFIQTLSMYPQLALENRFPEKPFITRMSDVTALIAYSEPEQSPLALLLGNAERERVAIEVNNAILGLVGVPKESVLERLVRQTTVVRECMSSGTDKSKWQFSQFIANTEQPQKV